MNDQAIPARRLAANYALLSTGEFIAKLLGAIAFAYLARVFGPQRYGDLEFALAIIFFFTLFVDSGLSAYGAREVAKNKDAVARFAAHIVGVRSMLALVAFALVVASVSVIDKPGSVKQLILLYGLTLFGLPGLLQWIFQGVDWMQYVALASVIRWTIFAAGVFLFVRGPEQVWIVPLVEGSAIGGLVIFYYWSVTRHFGSFRQRIDRIFAFTTYRQAFPIGASEMVWAVKVYFATVLLGTVVGGSEVGWFGAAHRIVISLHTFVWLYFFNLLPSMSRTTQKPVDALERLMATSMRLTAWSAVFIGVAGTVFAEPLIALVYGEQYREATSAFQVLIWLIPLTLLHGHYRFTLIAYGRQHLEFLSTAGGAALNVVLNLLLVPTYGLMGSAWALVISELLIWGLAYYFVRRRIAHMSMWAYLHRPLLAGVLLTGVLLLLPKTPPPMALGTAIIVYGLCLSILQPKVFNDVRSLFHRSH